MGAPRRLIYSYALALVAACSMDLETLQRRADAGGPVTNPATDPTPLAGRAGAFAGMSGGGAGAGIAAGPAGAGAGGTPPSAAGAGGGTIPPKRTCGVAGLPCCTPSNSCDLGACLRGKCTPYGGFYSHTDGCTQNPCASRNAYTAGCACPSGFDDTLLFSRAQACETGDATTELHSCTAGRSPEMAFGGVWIEGPDASCKRGCRTPNPVTGQCGCPNGTLALALPVGPADARCGTTELTLQVCIDAAAKPLNFGGAYALSQTAALGCGAPNPMTGSCTCPEEVTTPQSLHAGSWSVFVCNL